MTHRHAHRIAGAGDAKLAAAAGGAANGFGHRAAFLSATRTSVSSVAPAPSSSFSAATALPASPGLYPRPVSAEIGRAACGEWMCPSVLSLGFDLSLKKKINN